MAALVIPGSTLSDPSLTAIVVGAFTVVGWIAALLLPRGSRHEASG
jgi:hypothetical protein